jgi:hypothetical protein
MHHTTHTSCRPTASTHAQNYFFEKKKKKKKKKKNTHPKQQPQPHTANNHRPISIPAPFDSPRSRQHSGTSAITQAIEARTLPAHANTPRPRVRASSAAWASVSAQAGLERGEAGGRVRDSARKGGGGGTWTRCRQWQWQVVGMCWQWFRQCWQWQWHVASVAIAVVAC